MAAQGWRITGFQVGEAKIYDADRVIFTLTYTQEGDAPEAGPPGTSTVPVVMHRGEDGMWRFAGGVLERRPLFGGPVTQMGLSVQPHLWTVGPAGIEVVVRLSNGGNGTIKWPTDRRDCALLRLADGQELRARCPQPPQAIPPGGRVDVSLSFPLDVLACFIASSHHRRQVAKQSKDPLKMRKHRLRITAFLIFGLGGTLAGLVIRLLPLHIPDVGIPFFVGWWIAAAIGSMFFPQGGGGNSSE